MFSSVQAVFLFDINCFKDFSSSPNQLESYISVLKLTCLRLLTEFGAQTENGSDVRWAAKYYDSTVFKPGKANSSFSDFNRTNFDSFVCDLAEKLRQLCEIKGNSTNTRSPPNRKSRRGPGNTHSHCFILNKAIQEALKDYNWDLPDINSPVQFCKTRHNSINEEKLSGIYNAIIVFNTFPHDVDSIKKFIGDDLSDGSSKILLKNLLENATLHELQACKSFRLHFVDTAARRLHAHHNLPVYSATDEYLSKLNGALHCISSAVDCTKIFCGEFPLVHSTLQLGPHLQGLESSWFHKNARSSKGVGRFRRPQPGPELVWEDSNGSCFLNIKLEILVLQGRGSSVWNQASVTGVARTGAAVLASVGAPYSQIILCREQHKQNADTILDKLLFLLHQHNILLLLRLTCGGLALLTPFVGAVASLVVLSSSGLSTPPLAPRLEEDSLVTLATQPLLNFARSAVIKALSSGGGVAESTSGTDAPACHASAAKGTTAPLFSRCMMESWYSGQPATMKLHQKPLKATQQLASVRRTLLTRAQRRYCPTVRGLFPTPDITVIPTANQSCLLERRHDQTSTVGFPAAQPSGGAAAGVALARTASIHHLSSTGGGAKAASAGQGGGAKTAAPATASRALRLVNKSKIVTAQQKVKELEEEESEREVARERRVLQSTLRSQRSRALITNTLNTIPDTKDGAAVVQSLCELRESVNGSSAPVGDTSTSGDSQAVTDGSDLFGTAQTIINIALMHVRSAADSAASSSDVPAATDTGEGLRDILAGVMFNWRDISALPSHCHLPQYQLHVLLHLEIMWLLGYSSFPAPNDADGPQSPERQRRCVEREAHVEEILRLLRAITLNFAPHTTTAFLTNTILPNYEDTLSEVLVEVYEELNQPLPASLAEPMSVDTVTQSPALHQSSSRPASALSAGSMMGSGGGAGRGGIRRRNSNMAVVTGVLAGRQVVVPGSRMARLTRASSDVIKGARTGSKKSKVRRSLFDGDAGNSPPSLRRSHTIATTPTVGTKKRKRDATESAVAGREASVRDNRYSKRLQRTPRDERKRRKGSGWLGIQGDAVLQKDGLFTPNKYELASPLSKRNRMSVSNKKGHVVLCPATPAHLSGRAAAQRSVGVATANTSIAESPEVKGGSRITPHRLRASLLLKRRSSFYSGGQSRNCQRANTSLMVQRLQGKSKEQQDDSALLVEKKPKEQSSEPMDSSFLFSKIFSSVPPAANDQSVVDGSKSENLPKRKRVGRRALNFDSVDDRVTVDETRLHSLAASNSSPVTRRAARSNGDERLTPVKKVTKILNLDTPTKVPGVHNPIEDRSKIISPSPKSSPVLPSRNGDFAKTPQRNTDAMRLMYLHSPSSSSMTPSKRVQFSLHLTPSKTSSTTTKPATPKSILKTPNRNLPSGARTPLRGTPSRGYLTPSRRPTLQILMTSQAVVPQSPDMFSSAKKDPSLLSPNETPAKFPVQDEGNSSEKFSSEVGTSKFRSTATPDSTILHETVSRNSSIYNSSRGSDLSKSSKRSVASFMSPEKENMQLKSPFNKNSPVLKTTLPTALQLERRSGRVLSFAGNKLLLSPRKSVVSATSPAVESLCSDASKGKTSLGVINCSTLENDLTSFDLAVCVDRSCFTTETELELVSPMKKSKESNASLLVYKNFSSSSLSSCTQPGSKNELGEPSRTLTLHKQKTADHCVLDLTESPSTVKSLSEFIERLDHMAEADIKEDEVPILLSDNAMLIETLEEYVTSQSVKLLNPPIYALGANPSSQSVADETCDFFCLGDIDLTEAASTVETEECLPAPLLDIPAMLEDKDHALKLHKYWLHDNANYFADRDSDDSNSTSPEIEMPLEIRKNLEEALSGRLQSNCIPHNFPDSDTNVETFWAGEPQPNIMDVNELPIEESSQLTIMDGGECVKKQSTLKDPDLANLSQLEFEQGENSSLHENHEKLPRVAVYVNENSNDENLTSSNKSIHNTDFRKVDGCQRIQPDTVTRLGVVQDTNYSTSQLDASEAASGAPSSYETIIQVDLPACVETDHTELFKEHASKRYKNESGIDTDDKKSCAVNSNSGNFQIFPDQQSNHLASITSSLRPRSKSYNGVTSDKQSAESAFSDCVVMSTDNNGSADELRKRTRIQRQKTEVTNQTPSSNHDSEYDSSNTVIPPRSNRRPLKLVKSHCAQLDDNCFSPIRARRGRTRKNNKRLRSSSHVMPVEVHDVDAAEEIETVPETKTQSVSRRSSRISTDKNFLSTSELGRKSKRSLRVGSVNYCENYESDDEMFIVQKALKLSKRHESDNSEDDLFVPRSSSKPKQSKLGYAKVSPLASRSRIGFSEEQYNKKNSGEIIFRRNEAAKCSNTLKNSPDVEEENVSSGGKRQKINKPTCEKNRTDFSPQSNRLLRPDNRSDLDGSLFSPNRSLCDRSLGITPLQNMENISNDSDGSRRRTRAKLATSYVDFPSDDSAFDVESSLNDTGAGFLNASSTTPATATPIPALETRPRRLPLQQTQQPHQAKIDQYLSPVRRSSGDEAPLEASPFVDVKPKTGGEIDWKQVKPIRARQKLVEEAEIQKANKASKMNIRMEDEALDTSVIHKKKKRRVKLKFTKKNEHEYRVIRQNVSGSSLNTTVSDLQTSINDVSLTDNTKESSLSNGKKKKRSSDAFTTPLRFTRHMSKDTSITPELFQKLIAYSPNSKNTHSNVSTIAEEEKIHEEGNKSPEKIPSIPSTSHQTPTRNVSFTKNKSSKKTGDGLWRVESAEDSPTLKTFIRMQKTLHSIDMTPSVRLASSRLGSPSIRSMLHLSTSPIVDKCSSNSAKSRKGSLTTGSCVRLDIVPNGLIGDMGHNGGEVDNVSHPRKRQLESNSSEGQVSKRRRSRSPVSMPTKPRSSKRLYS